MSIAMQEWPRRHRISVAHYYRMAEAGLFEPDERVELIDGEIVDMPPMGIRHASAIARLADSIAAAVGARAMVRSQLPLRLGDLSEPQPDIAVVVPRSDYYEQHHPTAGDTLLVIELGDATLRFDLDVKAPLYSRHGVPEVWVIDLRGNRLHTFRASAESRQILVTESALSGVAIAALPNVTLDLALLRGRA
jgi:Uma2 family endonuclease